MPVYTTPEQGFVGDQMTDLLASTLSLWVEKNFVNQVYRKTPLLEWLRDRQEVITGGESLTVPVSYGTNTAGTFYEGLGIIPPIPQKNLGWAIYTPTEYALPIAISQRDLDLNSGSETAMVRLLNFYLTDAIESGRNVFGTVVYKGTLYHALAPNGLCQICSTSGTLGGINSSTYTWWQSQYATASNIGTPASSNLIEKMMEVKTNVDIWAKPGDQTTIFCHPEFFRYFYLHLSPYERYEGGSQKMTVTPKELWFADSQVIPDPFCYPHTDNTSGTIWFVNGALRSWVHANANWKQGKPQEPIMQTAIAIKIRYMGQNGTDKRRALGYLEWTR